MLFTNCSAKTFRFARHQPCFRLDRHPYLQPHDQLRNLRTKYSVRPIITFNTVLIRISERFRILDRKGRARLIGLAGKTLPAKALLAYVGRYGAILGDDGFAPCLVLHACGGRTSNDV